jgi:hypothetical protein
VRNEVRTFGELGKGINSMPKCSMKSVAGFMVGCAEEEGQGGRKIVISE